MTRPTVMIDGTLVPHDQATVSVFDRGFLYGDSVFETIRTYEGVPFALDEHLSRLARSAELVLIDLPVELRVLASEVAVAVRAGGFQESYVRVMITRGQGQLGLAPGAAVKPLRVIIVSELVPPEVTLYERGARAISFVTMRPSDATTAVGAKIGNYLVAVLATRAAKEAGAYEALIANAEGRVVEGATSNVFWVAEGRLCTPPVDAGILAGITRDRILQVAALTKLDVKFESPSVRELQSADELFISSSIREIVPIVDLDGVRIANGEVGPISRKLTAGFHTLVKSEHQ